MQINGLGLAGSTLHPAHRLVRIQAESTAAALRQKNRPLVPAQVSPWEVLDTWQEQLNPRWPVEAMPVSVWLEPHAAWPQASAMLITALSQWMAASEGELSLELATSPRQSNIRITWQEETTLGRDYEVGHTNRRLLGDQIQSVHITLITHPIIDGHLSPTAQEQRLYATLLHEMGHALGLEHSECAGDVMHHRGWRQTRLTANDQRRLRVLY